MNEKSTTNIIAEKKEGAICSLEGSKEVNWSNREGIVVDRRGDAQEKEYVCCFLWWFLIRDKIEIID